MIYLEKGQKNTFVLTLTEVTTYSSPYYLFVFENEFNTATEPILWAGIDTSPYPDRYNLFGIFADFVKGQYTYSVYESPEPITIDENTNVNDYNLIEQGRMIVAGEVTNSIYD